MIKCPKCKRKGRSIVIQQEYSGGIAIEFEQLDDGSIAKHGTPFLSHPYPSPLMGFCLVCRKHWRLQKYWRIAHEQRKQLADKASKMLGLRVVENAAKSLPAGPFVELLKTAVHFQQVPSCGTCKDYTNEGWCFHRFEGGGEPLIGNAAHFCAEWKPKA